MRGKGCIAKREKGTYSAGKGGGTLQGRGGIRAGRGGKHTGSYAPTPHSIHILTSISTFYRIWRLFILIKTSNKKKQENKKVHKNFEILKLKPKLFGMKNYIHLEHLDSGSWGQNSSTFYYKMSILRLSLHFTAEINRGGGGGYFPPPLFFFL